VRGAEAVESFLDRHRRVGLDTSVFIFETEKNPKYIELVRPVFRWLMGPAGLGVTSTITMLEVLVQPYRAGDQKRAGDFLALLSTYPHLQWIAPTLDVMIRAASLRAAHNLSTPDAIQAATAMLGLADGFISNDAAFRRLNGLDVLVLDDLTPLAGSAP